MTQPVSRDVLRKIRRLAQLPDEVRQSPFGVSITRLTVLKSLCQEPDVASRFATYLAQRTRQKVEEKTRRPGHLSVEEWARHREMIDRAVTALEQYRDQPSDEKRSRLGTLFRELAAEQNDYRRVYGGPVRVIQDNDLLLVEYALRTVLADEASAPQWAYQTARCYAERYDVRHGTGLIPASVPLVQDIADFWVQEFGLGPESITTPARAKRVRNKKSPSLGAAKDAAGRRQEVRFTHRQGQFLAFIHLYRQLRRQGPAELDMVKFFRVTPPSVHGMVVKLEQLGLITREPGVPRSVRVAIPEEEIPALEPVQGPPW
jgi:hypothetical protein